MRPPTRISITETIRSGNLGQPDMTSHKLNPFPAGMSRAIDAELENEEQ